MEDAPMLVEEAEEVEVAADEDEGLVSLML
jgi:hypothetical protein